MRSCRRFLAGIPHLRADTHVLLTRPPLPALRQGVRLACVRHAASVYPEPGSNSPFSSLSSIPRTGSKRLMSSDQGTKDVTSWLLVFADSRELTGTVWGTRARRAFLASQLQFCFPHFNCQGASPSQAINAPRSAENEQLRKFLRLHSLASAVVVCHRCFRLSRGLATNFFARPHFLL
jgi:hypothetical protein